MKEYMYLFRGGDGRELNQSPEQMQAHMQAWGVWMQALGKSGNFVTGLPLQSGGKVVENHGEVITDGPFAEGKELVGGYLIVKANDLDHAADLSKQCPIFERGGTVEVREIMPMDI
ncbi:MAG: YciI family protein [Cyclobacteriaceae bacterium]